MRLVKTDGRGGQQLLSELELRGGRNGARDAGGAAHCGRCAQGRRPGAAPLCGEAGWLDAANAAGNQPAEMEQAWEATPKPLQAAMQTAAGNIRRFRRTADA